MQAVVVAEAEHSRIREVFLENRNQTTRSRSGSETRLLGETKFAFGRPSSSIHQIHFFYVYRIRIVSNALVLQEHLEFLLMFVDHVPSVPLFRLPTRVGLSTTISYLAHRNTTHVGVRWHVSLGAADCVDSEYKYL